MSAGAAALASAVPFRSPDAAPLRSGLSLHVAGSFRLESGQELREVVQAYRVEGRLNPARDNLVLLFHSLTGSPADFGGWDGLVGEGRPLDTRRLCVVAPNLLGSCYGTRFAREGRGSRAPLRVTTRDMARLAGLLVERLGARRVALAAGGSLGGMVALEWASSFPGLTAAVAAFAAPAGPCAWGSGWNHVHRQAVRAFGMKGLALARMVGMLTYRTPSEFEARFRPGTDGHPVRGYLSHHGEKLVRRFSASSYLALLDAMDAHDVGRGRGGVAAALSPFRGRLVGVGIPGDLLYPSEVVREWTEAAGAGYRVLPSGHGHDGFLVEPGVGELLGELARGPAERSRPVRPLGAVRAR